MQAAKQTRQRGVPSPRLVTLQGASQIGEKIRLVLQADREPDQSVCNADRMPGLSGHARMRHRGRVGDQALNATEGLGQREHFERLHEPAHGIDTPYKLKAQHGAKAALLGFGDPMSAMGLQARVVDRRHGRVSPQESGNDRSRFLLTFDAGEQRAQPA